jgi:hypothetical protein
VPDSPDADGDHRLEAAGILERVAEAQPMSSSLRSFILGQATAISELARNHPPEVPSTDRRRTPPRKRRG